MFCRVEDSVRLIGPEGRESELVDGPQDGPWYGFDHGEIPSVGDRPDLSKTGSFLPRSR
jgi:hypothetical protein